MKLIAEPWDLGEGGYQVGNFPIGWAEWNDRYRNCVRAFWKGDGGLIGETATRITGSSDLYGTSGRRPHASINFVTSHDGFTLTDLVSYDHKHNEANLEDNRDGHNDNLSWNCGAEGPTDDPEINAPRARQRRNFIATLLLSQGVPMLLAGDEIGRTQRGNNNAYCQDNEISWIDWTLAPERSDLVAFVQRMLRIRREHPVFRRRNFFQGRPIRGRGIKDILWLNPEGGEMSDEQWSQAFARCLGVFLAGDALDETDRRGRPIVDDSFLVLVNAHHEAIDFHLPVFGKKNTWLTLIDTTHDQGLLPYARLPTVSPYRLTGRSLVLLHEVREKP